MTTADRLSMPLGESIFTQRAIRRFKPDPIPEEDLRDILEAAIRAPNGGNSQPWHFLVVRDEGLRTELGGGCTKRPGGPSARTRASTGPKTYPRARATAARPCALSGEFAHAPVVVMLCSTSRGNTGSVIPAAQNLLLAARAMGVGGTITTLHAQVDERAHRLFGIPEDVQIVYCLPLGIPQGQFWSGATQGAE